MAFNLADIPKAEGNSNNPKKEDSALESFGEIDLEQELLESYNNTKALYVEVEDDQEVPTNHKVAVLANIRAIQEQILRAKERVHNVQNLAKLEAALVRALKQFPELNGAFFKIYEEELSK